MGFGHSFHMPPAARAKRQTDLHCPHGTLQVGCLQFMVTQFALGSRANKLYASLLNWFPPLLGSIPRFVVLAFPLLLESTSLSPTAFVSLAAQLLRASYIMPLALGLSSSLSFPLWGKFFIFSEASLHPPSPQ